LDFIGTNIAIIMRYKIFLKQPVLEEWLTPKGRLTREIQRILKFIQIIFLYVFPIGYI
jgi:hypothetical protein